MNLWELFEIGAVCGVSGSVSSDTVDYTPHKAFKGVFLKHLVKGERTENRLSCHLIKVEPFCVLDTHVHPENIELHQVIGGEGECRIADNTVVYKPGTLGVIPANTEHRVTAGKDGLYMLAVFTPALL